VGGGGVEGGGGGVVGFNKLLLFLFGI
jgi:hypothetical protein